MRFRIWVGVTVDRMRKMRRNLLPNREALLQSQNHSRVLAPCVNPFGVQTKEV